MFVLLSAALLLFFMWGDIAIPSSSSSPLFLMSLTDLGRYSSSSTRISTATAVSSVASSSSYDRSKNDYHHHQYKPVNCRSFVKQEHFDTDPASNEKNLVRTTKTKISFLMSLHKEKHDKVRWDIVTYGRYYEWDLEQVWTQILEKSQRGARIVDVGGNVGYYSLLSASVGKFHVDSFEPNPSNVLRFCESVGVNHWGAPPPGAYSSDDIVPQINIFQMGLSDQQGDLSFYLDAENPGAGRFVSQDVIQKSSLDQKKIVTLPVITLDSFATDNGWFQQNRTIVILKVDVEKHEAQVFLGAKQLLKSRIVQNIFTEVAADADHKAQIQALQLIVDAGYHLRGHGSFRGPSEKPSPWKLDGNLPNEIIKHIAKGEHPYLNLWWSLSPQ